MTTTKEVAKKVTCSTITGLFCAAIISGLIGIATLIILPFGIACIALAGILSIAGLILLGMFLISSYRSSDPMSRWCKFNIFLSVVALCVIIGFIIRLTVDSTLQI